MCSASPMDRRGILGLAQAKCKKPLQIFGSGASTGFASPCTASESLSSLPPSIGISAFEKATIELGPELQQVTSHRCSVFRMVSCRDTLHYIESFQHVSSTLGKVSSITFMNRIMQSWAFLNISDPMRNLSLLW